MAYLKYSFDIEDGFSNSKSTKQYGSSYSHPDLEQHDSSYNPLAVVMEFALATGRGSTKVVEMELQMAISMYDHCQN